MMRRICTATDAPYREIETDVSVASRDSEGECDMGSESCGGYRITGDTFTMTDVPHSPSCSIFFFNRGAGECSSGVLHQAGGRIFLDIYFSVIEVFG